MAATELQWTNTPQGTMVVKRIPKELTQLDYNVDDNETLDFIDSISSSKYSRDLLDPDLNIFIRSNPLEGIEQDYPGGLMRSNMIHVLLRYIDRFGWASSNEKFGDPLVVALYDKMTSNNEDLAAIDEGLKQLGTDAKAKFSKDIELKFLEAMRSGITDMHEKFQNSVKEELAVEILGQPLTSTAPKTGSFAQAKVQNYVREDILWGDILLYNEAYSEQYVAKDYLLNYGEPRNAYPMFEFNTDDAEDFESNARVLADLRSSFPEIKFKAEEIYKKTGLTKPQPEDEIL